MRQKWKEEQFVEISMSELFVWWDWLDSLKDTPEKAFDLFTKFLENCEDQLEFNEDFIDEMLDDEEFIPIIDGDKEFFNDMDEKGIPFIPRHDF